MKRTKPIVVLLVLAMSVMMSACSQKEAGVNYSEQENWAYCNENETDKSADIFFVAPTVYSGDESTFNMPLDDEKAKQSFLGSINMEKGIYDGDARMFAPYYRQAGLNVYKMTADEAEPYLTSAYEDVKAAFSYYMDNYNNGRPIVLAGFSQGADMCIRLMKDYFNEGEAKELLVACYAIGWRITQEELDEYPGLKFAEGEDDTGVIVAFNSEAEDVKESLLIPEGVKTLAINPLNWTTDGTPADKSLNLGACFTNYSGEIKSEIPNLTGAYIDDVRGALKVTDVTSEEYPPGLDIFEDGVYHLYDYQFFYRNLEENVNARINAFVNK